MVLLCSIVAAAVIFGVLTVVITSLILWVATAVIRGGGRGR
jgi:hypothetical protein